MREFPRQRIADLLGREPVHWVEQGGGYTDAGRWTAEFAEGPPVFIKASADPDGDSAVWSAGETNVHHLEWPSLRLVISGHTWECPDEFMRLLGDTRAGRSDWESTCEPTGD